MAVRNYIYVQTFRYYNFFISSEFTIDIIIFTVCQWHTDKYILFHTMKLNF